MTEADGNDANGVSGYSRYAPELAERTLVNESGLPFPELPAGPYDIIYADPPWDYGGKTQFDKSSMKEENKGFAKPIFMSAAGFQYPTMKLDELKAIPVAGVANPEAALLFMWTSSPHLPQALELGAAWGFEYRTVAFVWDKMVHNPGQYTLSYCELCLVFKRGRIPSPRGSRNEKQLVSVKRGRHSAKPGEVRAAIERMFPGAARLEMFARTGGSLAGWDVWGFDATNPC